MKLFSRIVWDRSDSPLLNAVRALAGTAWSTTPAPVVLLRKRLLKLQGNRCVYCQAVIEADENGYRELDHVLPKNRTQHCTPAKGKSNTQDKRRHTLGYPQFTYEPRNLVVTCKQCNTLKGSYDSLKERSRPPVGYPRARDFIWVHPQLAHYEVHITVSPEFLFVGRTQEGKRVIEECGLADADVLARKFLYRARVRASVASDLSNAVDALVASVRSGVHGVGHAVQALIRECDLDHEEAEHLLADQLNETTAERRARTLSALRVVGERLRRRRKSVKAAARALL